MESVFHKRLNSIAVAFVVAMMAIVLRLTYIQIVHGASYRIDADDNRFRQIVQEAPRGKIIDAHGVVLAANQPKYFITMHHTRNPELDTVLARLVAILDPKGDDPERISVPEFRRRLHAARFRRWQPVLLFDTPLVFGDTRLVQIEEQRMELPGVTIDVQPRRSYPLGQSAAHVIGGVGIFSGDTQALRNFQARFGSARYRRDSTVGRYGLERAYDFMPAHLSLRGSDGLQLVEVDHLSRLVRDIGLQAPMPGNNLHLTLDSTLQQHIESWLPVHLEKTRAEAYAAGVRGNDLGLVASGAAVVAIDPHNGAILAMVSSPAFDPAQLIVNYRALSEDPRRPLHNKALVAFAPGSIFKPVTEIAGMAHGAQAAMPRVVCAGRLMDPWLGDFGKPCWIEYHDIGHGPLDDITAMRVSCNIYYYHIALQLFRQLGNAAVLDTFANTAAALGLGAPSPLNTELFGFAAERGELPTSEQFRRTVGASPGRGRVNPFPGEVADIAIGQGIQTYTPLQIANMMGMLATGHRYENFIVDKVVSPAGEVVSRTQPIRLASLVRTPENPGGLISAAQLARLREGLKQVTQVGGLGLNSGTAAGAFRAAPYFSAGKTGTAEIRLGRQAMPSHGWFAGWAAHSDTHAPEIVVAVLVQHGRGGGLAAAPIAREVFDAYFRLQAHRAGR